MSQTVVLGLVSVQGWFHSPTATSGQDFKWWQRHKDDLPVAVFPTYRPGRLVSLSQGGVCTGWCLVVPGQLREELGWGPPNYCKKQVHHHHSAVDRPLQKVRLKQQGLGLNMSHNGVFKIKVILLFAFLSDHTKYVRWFDRLCRLNSWLVTLKSCQIEISWLHYTPFFRTLA